MAPPPPPGIESVVARPHRDDARTTPGRYGGSKFFLGGAIAAMLLLGIAALLDSANAYTSRDTSAAGTSNRVLATLATTDGARSARSRGTPRARDTGPSQRESHSVADPATPPQRLPAAAAEPPETVTRPHAPADANGARPGPEPEPAVTIVLELTAQPSDSRSPGEAARDEGVLVSGTTITHVVVKGDTLWDICERYLGDPFRYPEVAGWSSIVDPHWIYLGDLVRIVIR